MKQCRFNNTKTYVAHSIFKSWYFSLQIIISMIQIMAHAYQKLVKISCLEISIITPIKIDIIIEHAMSTLLLYCVIFENYKTPENRLWFNQIDFYHLKIHFTSNCKLVFHISIIHFCIIIFHHTELLLIKSL